MARSSETAHGLKSPRDFNLKASLLGALFLFSKLWTAVIKNFRITAFSPPPFSSFSEPWNIFPDLHNLGDAGFQPLETIGGSSGSLGGFL